MSWFSILYFIFITFSTGTIVDLLIRNWQAGQLEKLIVRCGVGMASLSVIGVLLNLLHLPLDYRLFFLIGLLILGAALMRHRSVISAGSLFAGDMQVFKTRSFWYGLVVLVLFAVTLQMYLSGSFLYSYFEDTDPWGYAAVADYIGENRTFTAPYYSVQYGEPYTQGYQIIMGMLSQTNDSVYWTMKFFNALINSLGVLFMYCFARRFSRDEDLGLLAAIFLFAVPAWVSHFVFSLHYNMTVFVVLLYVLAQMMQARDSDPRQLNLRSGWLWVGVIVYASILINHFSTAVHATLFCLAYLLTRILTERRINWNTLLLFCGGGLLSMSFYIPAYTRHWWVIDSDQQLGGMRALFPLIRLLVSPLGLGLVLCVVSGVLLSYRFRKAWQPGFENWLAVGNRGLFLWLVGLGGGLIVLLLPIEILHSFGTGDRFYAFADFFSAKSNNLMNNPIGLGPVVMTLLLGAFIWAVVRLNKLFRSDSGWEAVGFAWVITAFILVLGKYLSVAIAPFRAWTFLGLFASLFAAWGVVSLLRAITIKEWVPGVVIVLLMALVIPTTFVPKYELNTMVWQDHTIGVPESHELFAWMREGGIPKSSVVAHLCGNSQFLSGYDMNPPLWDETFHPQRDRDPYFVRRPLELDSEALKVLKAAETEYVTLGATCLWQAPVPVEREEAYGYYLREKMDQYMKDPRLSLVKNTGLEVLLKLK